MLSICSSFAEQAPSRDFDMETNSLNRRPLESLAPWKVKKAKMVMLKLMTQRFSIALVAKECSVSRSHFSRAFKNATGLAPHDWFRREQISKAEELLKDTGLPICRIAQDCGFSDQSYFTRVFTQAHGVSPKRWQKINKSKPETVDQDKV